MTDALNSHLLNLDVVQNPGVSSVRTTLYEKITPHRSPATF
jgi:hypothetical protein